MGGRSSNEVAVKELRLGLVCYGGVSLAIYMHGITKELHKLVLASREYEKNSESHSFGSDTTERFYWEFLRRIEDEKNVRWRVVIDVISGTSAGGINGIFLAKALANDLNQDELRNLWMVKGDINKLMRGASWLPKFIRVPYVLWGAMRRSKSPLRGELMSRWLLDALQGMKPRVESNTLVDSDGSLELFVTMTDFRGYRRYIPIKGLTLSDRRHRHVLPFTFDRSTEQDQFTEDYDRVLAFGARATSSFPGAFAPISVRDFDSDVGGSSDPKILTDFFRIYELSGAPPLGRYFVDGGVLDNFPFGHTIEAIHRKPANTQVVRRLVYIEPHPDSDSGSKSDDSAAPKWLATIWGGLSKIPAKEPILDDLLRVRERNERVDRIRDVIRSSEDKVAKALPVDPSGLGGNPTQEQVDEWNQKSHEAAAKLIGAGYEAYLHIKAVSVVRAFADTLSCVANFPRDSNEGVLLRRATAHWAREEHIIGERDVAPEVRLTFLKSLDLPYTARRLRFIIDGVNSLYGDIDNKMRASLDDAKETLYQLRSGFVAVLAGRGLPDELIRNTHSILREAEVSRLARDDDGPSLFMKAKGEDFKQLASSYMAFCDERFKDFGSQLFAEFLRITRDWPPESKGQMVIRHVGFPIWDALVFPMLEIGDLGEIEPISVVRFSPDDAIELSNEGAEGKLVGVGLHHFKAFFSQEGRENDYAWGRLDGAESLIKLLSKEAGFRGDTKQLYSGLFKAVFKQEADLAGARKLQQKLRV